MLDPEIVWCMNISFSAASKQLCIIAEDGGLKFAVLSPWSTGGVSGLMKIKLHYFYRTSISSLFASPWSTGPRHVGEICTFQLLSV